MIWSVRAIVANLLSVLRMLLAPLVLWSLHREVDGHTTMLLLIVGGATDMLDGQVVVRTAGPLSDNNVQATVTQVLGLRVSLAAIAENGNCLVLEQ